MTAPLLQVRNVRKAFGGVEALAGVGLEVAHGEIRAVIGPNGAGKTTLFNVITGQLRCDAGEILFRGRRVDGLAPHRVWRRGISRTFQITATFAGLTLLENVQVAVQSSLGQSRSLFGRAADLAREPALQLLGRVGLAEQAGAVCGTLSLGDLKRVELAMALANNPELLLLDEPTAGMAPAERMDLVTHILSIVRERGVSVLFTEHDMDVVFAAAERITVLHQGRVLAEDTPHAVRENPAVQAIYLGGSATPGGAHDV